VGRPLVGDQATQEAVTRYDEVLDEVRRVLVGIRHGSVTLIVQDGQVVQIDATRKVRLGVGPRSASRTGPSG
jgi:hypothetical protein